MVTPEVRRLAEIERAFVRGRLELAAAGVLAAGVLMFVAWALGVEGKTFWFGVALMALSAASLYFGRAPGRAVLPAFVIGVIPFSALLIVQAMSGHGCHTGGCNTLCLPTCVASGLVAGALVATVAVRVRETTGFVVAAGTMVWLVGALGCPCIAWSSVAGMAAGIAAPSLWVLFVRRRQA
ncbi:MAG: hypothetical protein AAF500_18565 [Myxococcota bacterium]